MIPVVLGLAALAAKAAGLAAIPRLVKALTASLQRPDFPLTQAPSNKAPTAISSGIVEPTALSSPKAALLEGPSIPENQPENALPTVLRGPATRPVVKEYNGDGTVKASYFLGATGRQAIKVNGVWYIYLKDTHGSVTGLVDLAGNRVATYEADPYGEPLVDVNPNNIYNPYRWNGEQLDAESGLTYMRNRYYQAATGRFIQRDPISYAGGLNLYSFPTDPINSADPTGLQPNVTDYGRVLAEREAAQKLFRAYQEWAEANIYPTEGTSDVSFPLLGDFLTGKALGSLMRLPGRAVARSAGAGARHVGAAGADELFHEGLVFSREELLKGGEVIAKGANGAGEIPGIRDIAKLVKEHGGKPRDWEKVKNFIGATEQTSGDLVGPLRMHYYRNATTGQIAKFGEKELQSGQW